MNGSASGDHKGAPAWSTRTNTDVMGQLALDKETEAKVELSRLVYKKHTKNDQEKSALNFSLIQCKFRTAAAECCRVQNFFSSVVSFLPVLSWLPAYQWKTDLVPDFLAGLTVGIMSIPQGMAYARLAGLPPVYGLYTNIIPTFVYFLLGTTRHAAIGPATVLSLILSSIRYKHIPCEDCWMNSNLTFNDSSNVDIDSSLTPIDIGTAVSFLAGSFMILMGLFRLSFISDYLPEQLVGGFTVACAVQVFAGQLKSIFGVQMPNRNGIGKVIMNFIDLFIAIGSTNLATFIIFTVCFIFLVFSKYVINRYFQPLLKIPFPGEFIVMVVATIASHFGYFHEQYDVSVVSKIEAGMPEPRVPKVSIMGPLAADSFVLAVVTYTYSISLAKHYAKRNGYKIQSTQEFYAYGFMNFVGSFFQCFNAGQSVARSLVYEMAGAKSQLCGMFGTVVVIVTVLFIAPFLESLPNSALAAIIVTAVMEMLRNLRQLPDLFRKSKPEFSIFVVTLVSVIVLDVTYGLAVSVCFALVTVIFKLQRSRVESTNNEVRLLFVSDRQGDIEQQRFWRKILLLRPISSIFYANSEKVKQHLLDKIAITPENSPPPNDAINGKVSPGERLQEKPEIVILDMSSVPFTDLMGVNALKEVHQWLNKHGVEFYMSGCTGSVEELMQKVGFLGQADMPVFPTILDAISFARHRLIGSEKWPINDKLEAVDVVAA